MTDAKQLLKAIKALVPAAKSSNLTADSKGSDLFEVYVWTLVLRAADLEGAKITYEDPRGHDVLNDFFFRSSPGSLASTKHPYSYAVMKFDSCPALEAHLGIYVTGKSTVRHECDVAVLLREEAMLCRASAVEPRNSQVLLAVECKKYSSSDMGLSLGRSFLGLTHEIRRKDRFFVGSSGASSIEKLLGHHKRRYEADISPAYPERSEKLVGQFQAVFREFKAMFAPADPTEVDAD